jgi:hypothetical protein
LSGMRDGKESVKFMQVLDRGIFLKLKGLAKSRGVTVQELIRVLVIPDWMRKSQEEAGRSVARRRRRRLAGRAGSSLRAVAMVGPPRRKR